MNQRVSSAIMAIPLALLVIFLGRACLAATLLVLGLLAVREFYNLAQFSGYGPLEQVGIIGVIAFVALGYLGIQQGIGLVVTCIVILSLTWQTLVFGGRNAIANSAVTVLGSVYVGLPMASALMLRYAGGERAGFGYLLMAILTVWATDTGAYYGGKALGKRKLAPTVSPNKTCEGAIIGLAFGVAAGVVIRWLGAALLWWPHLGLGHSLILAVITSVTGQMGDLAESAFKRSAEVKDSGVFMPGHGGVLDRLDSLLLALPLVYYYVRLFLS
ncbi:MAG: phosphatidate cytidylyltransferase [Firmicutes bacterium]|nr:phosphatidate cytidylyltransferase [Bacillota bacterium]